MIYPYYLTINLASNKNNDKLQVKKEHVKHYMRRRSIYCLTLT